MMSLMFVTSSHVRYNIPSIPTRQDILTSHFVTIVTGISGMTIVMPEIAKVSIFMDNDLTHITDDHFEIKLIARLLNQIYVVQPPMLPPRYDDASPGEYEYSQQSTSIGSANTISTIVPRTFTLISYPFIGTRYGYMARISYKDVL